MNEHLFYAILPPLVMAELIFKRAAATYRKNGFGGHLISMDRLHISLFGLGPYHPLLVEMANRIANRVKMSPFEVSFDRALSFNQKQGACPFVLAGGGGLTKVHEVAEQLRIAWGGKRSSYTPHMTLIWDKRKIEAHEIQKPVSWTVNEFALVRSFVGQSRYEIVGQWPLGGES